MLIKNFFKIFFSLGKKYQILYSFSFLFLACNFIFDLISIAAVIPIIGVIFEQDYLYKNDIIENVIALTYNKFDFFHQNKKINLVFILSLLVIFFFFVKFVFSAFTNYYFIQLELSTKINFKEQILKKFFSKNNDFLYFNNLGSVNRITQYDVEHCSTYLFNFLQIFFDFLFSFTLIVTLFLIYGELTFSVVIFFLFFSIIYILLIQKKLDEDSKVRQIKTVENFKILNEIYISIKSLILFQKSKFFLESFIKQSKQLYKSYIFKIFFQKSLKNFLEFFIVTSTFAFIFYFSVAQTDLKKIFSDLAIFFIILLRLSPSVLRILSSYNEVKFSLKSVESIFNFLEKKSSDFLLWEEKKYELDEIDGFKKIIFKNVNFGYEKNEIFKNFNFEIVNNGLPIYLVGNSGVGKSSFLSLILGFDKIKGGEIFFDNRKFLVTRQFKRNHIGYLHQKSYLLDDTIDNNIIFGTKDIKINPEKLEISKKITGINKSNFDFNFLKKEKIGEYGNRLSGGQQQRIAIARIIYHDPKIIILDESTNALDNDSESLLMKNLFKWGEKKRLFIVVSHNLPNDIEIETIDFNRINLKN